ncbi:MAG TPA: HYR domain-containing protein [Ktedonobacterales bacterium]|nr:HYR domain-containing protein [Ktedonobacterales bacterium]
MSRMSTRLAITLALVLATLSWAAGTFHPAHAATLTATTLTVTDCSGETGVGRIGAVIGSASAGDTIGFSCSGTIPITSTLTISTNDLTLDGSGQTVILDGGGATQLFVVGGGITFFLQNVTLSHGFASNGGAISNLGTVHIINSTLSGNSAPSGEYGGAIGNGGTMTIALSAFSSNSAFAGGAIYNDNGGSMTISRSTFSSNSTNEGGAIYNDNGGSVSIDSSTLSGNSASLAGGAIFNTTPGSTVRITRSTLANNAAQASNGVGGAIANVNGGSVSITSSTIAFNSAPYSGGGIFDEAPATASFGASIIADNVSVTPANSEPTEVNCNNSGLYTDQGYNLEDDNFANCGFSGSYAYDMVGVDPVLGALGSNGGPTQTLPLYEHVSPAADYIPASTAFCHTYDQRGYVRPDDGETKCDIGAYEADASAPPDADPDLSNVPTDITAEATGPSGAAVTYTPPTATDEAGDTAPSSVTCLPASGATFALGATTVTCTATDADDTNSPVSQSFTVTVQDTTAPTLQLPGNITVKATSASGAVVTYSASATDLVDGADAVTCAPASGSTFPVATTTVNCSATDQAGNTATGSFTVTVTPLDSSAPTTTISLSPAQPNGQNGWYTGGVTASVSATDPDNASNTLTTRCVLDPASAPVTYSALPAGNCPYAASGGAAVGSDGVHTLYAASEDPAGNVETVQKSAIQIDQTAPIVTCATPAPTFVFGQRGATVSATVSDATSGPAQASISVPASTYSVGSNLSVSLTGFDKAGNSTTQSCPYAVTKASTSASLTSSLNPSMSGQAVTFTATLSVQGPGSGSISGSVTFKDGDATLGTGTVTTTNGVSTATYTTSSLALGGHSITAVYGGAASWRAAPPRP